MSEKTTLARIVLERIFEPDEALRKVDRSTEEYLGLVESIRMRGVMNPITIRELPVEEGSEQIYGLVDGLQRFSASKDSGQEDIPCHIISCEDGELIEAQIMANVHKIETKPVEYSKALLKVLQNNPLLTRTELAGRLAKTTSWISERLGLLKLTDEIGQLVDEGKIGLSNAYAMAKLPSEEQINFVDRAMTMTPQQFAPTVNQRVKEIRDANRKGRDVTPEDFRPIALLRSRKELEIELATQEAGSTLCDKFSVNSSVAGFALGIAWSLSLDPDSIEVQKARDEERRAEKERAKEKAKAERKKKRAEEAAEKATQLQKEAEEAQKEADAIQAVKEAAEVSL